MKTTTYILFSLILTSCFSFVEPNSQAEYIEHKSSFDTALVRHFPRILPNEYYGFAYSGERLQALAPSQYFHVKTRFKFFQGYKKQKDMLLKQAIYNLSSNDTCALKVYTGFAIESNKYIDSLNALNNDCATGYPIPNLCFPTSQLLIENPSSIYVIESDTTIFIENPDKPNLDYLPDNWKKGYSIGFTTNDTYFFIDYWLVVW